MKNAIKEKPKKPGFVFVGHVSDMHQNPMAVVHLMGKPVALFKRRDSTLFSREMSCKHQGADLTKRRMANGKVTCRRHGWQYDLETGKCLNRDSPPLREHAVTQEGDAVFVALLPMS